MAVAARYFAPGFVANIFFVTTLIAYWYSKDEPFWLAFFLIVSDGFLGFFGDYQAMLTLIPGLPQIELAQFYALIATIKAWNRKPAYPLFYQGFLVALLVYVIFLVLQGYAAGVSLALNMQFRILKLIVPMLLFFAIPRLFAEERQYRACFSYLFVVTITAFITQVFTVAVGLSPATYLGAADPTVQFAFEVTEGKTYRGFYNCDILVITQFGALFYLAYKRNTFNTMYLFGIVTANFISVLLSATRGWTVSVAMMTALFFMFVMQISAKRLAILSVTAVALVIGILSIPVIRVQIDNSFKRMQTMSAVAEGDLTAGGTLVRLNERAPRVMKVWAESPLTGWGFSSTYFYYQDLHVGNHNWLLHSGVLGVLLMALFFFYFFSKLYLLNGMLPRSHPLRGALLVFIVVFLGWFFLHSSSRQYFAYHFRPNTGIIQALFFSFGGLMYYKARLWSDPTEYEAQEQALETTNQVETEEEVAEPVYQY